MLDKELEDYKQLLGEKEFWKQYYRVCSKTQNIREHNTRYSKGKKVKPDLEKIKEKYKNGVTDDIIKEMLS